MKSNTNPVDLYGHRYPRLLRLVSASELPKKAVATWDHEFNLLRVDRDWWTRQHASVQNQVWKTLSPYLLESDFDSYWAQ